MRFQYFKPAADIRRHVDSYYVIDIPQGGADITRVEMPHVRFLMTGKSTLQQGEGLQVYKSPCILVTGPMMKAGYAEVSPNSLIYAASITPLGWQSLFGVAMRELAGHKAQLDDFHPINSLLVLERLQAAKSDAAVCAVLDSLFRSLLAPRRINVAAMTAISRWLRNPNLVGVGDFLKSQDLSHRQLDRLCNAYFGASPKQLHRKFRALHISNRLALYADTDWRSIVDDKFYDQAHFIKDFRELIGCTPGEYIRGRNMMIKVDLLMRYQMEQSPELILPE